MDNVRPKMCFSPSPPSPTPKTLFSSNLTSGYKCSSDSFSLQKTRHHWQDYNNNHTVGTKEQDKMQRPEDMKCANVSKTAEETTSDYKQWLHAMKLVARLPGGIPPEFRKKLWLSLADKYLKSKNVDWTQEEEKCFREKWREDDEELGIQIVKDLHRTGSTFCTGPAGDLNQAKLKRILLGYARYNPEVGYCQGFNMLGALILQVMDKNESESIKVMIYLVEGILPTGYFCGSMGGLQADMAVFRELMQTKLPRLAKHLQKLQGPMENAYEPPLTNVFTMQWFLTMFCTCLPMTCVLRVWDLVLIEGSDVLLRTALALWSLLEERVLSARSADDFYGKMGSFSSELLNGHLIDSNGLIEKVVQLGPIPDIQKLRDKHRFNIAPIERQQGLQFYFDDDEPDIDEDSRLAVATVWGIPWGRRGSHGQPNNNIVKPSIENKERIALDISLLKKQYDRLRERQKQAQIILTTACTTASRQGATASPIPVNQLLSGRSAIVTNKGRRCGPLTGAIPPARKPSLPAVLHDKAIEKPLRKGETLYWRDAKDVGNRRDSLSWKEIKAERAALITSGSIDGLKSQKIRSGRLGKSDSSSYSEESDDNETGVNEEASSTDTSLCDEDMQSKSNDEKEKLHNENNRKSSSKTLYKSKKNTIKQRNQSKLKDTKQKMRPKSWAPSNSEIPFTLMVADSPNHSADENSDTVIPKDTGNNLFKEKQNILTDETQTNLNATENLKRKHHLISPVSGKFVISNMEELPSDTFDTVITKDDISILDTMSLDGSNPKDDNITTFDIGNDGVTNEYFERVNGTERPTKLELFYSLNKDENVGEAFQIVSDKLDKPNEGATTDSIDKSSSKSNNIRCMDLLVDYSEKSSAACIAEAKTEISTSFQTSPTASKEEYFAFSKDNLLKRTKTSAEKRRDPRRLTLTRSSTMDIEKRYEAFEKRFSMQISNYTRFSDETELDFESNEKPHQVTSLMDQMNPGNNHRTLPTAKCISASKIIPSTADLEERFENIQLQLVKDRNRMIKSPCDSEKTDKQPILSDSGNNNVQRSSQNDKKAGEPIKNNENQEGHEILDGEQISNAHSDTKEKNSPSNESNNINMTITSSEVKANIGQKLPQSMSSEIKPSLQSKKEPPDETEYESIAEDGQSTHEHGKDSDEIEKVNDENRNGSKKISQKTSPPSTEELEKRFCALEEQIYFEKNESTTTARNTQKESDLNEENTEEPIKASILDDKILPKNKTEAHISIKNTSTDLRTSVTKFEMSETNTRRRLSEPPSTEDLERRYEVLKRRMSSRNFETRANELQLSNKKYFNKSTLNSPSKQSPPSIENLEERFDKLQNNSESKSATNKESPPSMENLEKRFEKLQSKNEITSTVKTKISSPSSLKQNPDECETSALEATKPQYSKEETISSSQVKDALPNEKSTEDPVKSDKIEDKNSSGNEESNAKASDGEIPTSVKVNTSPDLEKNLLESKNSINPLAKNVNQIKMKLIEELQAKIKENSTGTTDTEIGDEKKMAGFEKRKTETGTSDGKFLKPTQITPRQKPPVQNITLLPSLSFNDETLESHATSAYRKSEKHEPSNASNRTMVRRFSDLPSRADLENRLKFLEEQLSKTVCMQRRSSDSEVASKSRFKHKIPLANVRRTESLEYRVQELEKRLRDNRTFSMDVECSNGNEKNDTEIEVSQLELAADTAAITGKELVRYSSHGEVADTEHQSPINISINIQMTLNKDDIGTKKSAEVSKTEDIDKRLQFLEKRLKTALLHDNIEVVPDDAKETVRGKKERRNMGYENETNNDSISKHNSTEDIIQLINEDANTVNICQSNSVSKTNEVIQNDVGKDENEGDILTTDEPILVGETTSNIQNQNITDQSKNTKGSHLSKDKGSDKIGSSPKVIEENQNMESTIPDDPREYTNLKNQPALEVKEIEQKMIENRVQRDKSLDQTKSEKGLVDINTQKESIQTKIGSNKTENFTNSLQQNFQIQANESSDIHEISDSSNQSLNKTTEPGICEVDDISESKMMSEAENFIGLNKCSQFMPVEVNKKTLVLLLDSEPKAVKVRRLTRANTQELEDLFQALEKQLNDRGQQKICEKVSVISTDETNQKEIETAAAVSDLAKEIETFSKRDSNETEQQNKHKEEKQKKQEEIIDWGSDPIKHHLKKRTVYLPSTKELEARFRSLERQIKLLEDVEKIDVEQRLIEIERKIKLQYSLSHEKDLNKFLELCEGRDPDEISTVANCQDRRDCCVENVSSNQNHKCNSTRHISPDRFKGPNQPKTLEYSYSSLDFKKSQPKQSVKKQPIHPLEMLLDPSPDDTNIPTTGELEHRIRLMEEKLYTPPSPTSRKSRSQSPPIKKKSTHILGKITTSPTERELPTAEELEARLEALEREQCFDFKMQKDFKQFNQKLKDVVSPSLSFEEIKPPTKACDSAQKKIQQKNPYTTSPKAIRFYEENQSFSQKETDSTKTFAQNKESQQTQIAREGIGVMGIRLMRETSPLRRKGTHTGVPLRTGENINDQLTSIQNTIKSIDSLCEEKPYRKERCQQYIDSLFSESSYFAHKKNSLEDLTSRNLSRSTSREIGPSIKISDHNPAFSRSVGSADSIQLSSPLRSSSPLQYRSNRDLRREPSPRRRREEDREEHESRVRRDNLLPNNINHSHSILSHTSHSSLTKFHKVDSQLIPNDVENEHEHEYEEILQHPTTFGTINNTIYHDNTNTSNDVNTTSQPTLNAESTTPGILYSRNSNKPILTIYPTISSNNIPVYTPAKLEIRHTTVTSTFYDRVLTEKQLEKQHNLSFSSNNQSPSPLISPQFERQEKPIYQQQATKSPTNPQYPNDTVTILPLTDASTGNYHRSHQSQLQINNDRI